MILLLFAMEITGCPVFSMNNENENMLSAFYFSCLIITNVL